MDQSRITPLNTNQTSHTGTRAMNQNTAGNTAASQARTAASGNSGIHNSSQYGVVRAATNLSLGDMIRGEISDLSGGEITITLENNTMIRGQITDSSMLSIGQKAAFLLDSITPQGVLIKPVGNLTETEYNLIQKALEEANLPATEHNQSAVKALMDNMMPISRESIQQLMQQAYDNKTNDMNTLALMNKLMMKVTPDSIATFSHYRSGTDMLASQLQNYAAEIPSLLSALSEHGSAEAVAQFAETLLQVTMNGEPPASADPLTTGTLSTEEQKQLQALLSGTAMTEETRQALENGTLSLRDALTMLQNAALDGSLSAEYSSQQDVLMEKLILIEQTLEPANGQTAQQMQDSFQNIITWNSAAPADDPAATENIISQDLAETADDAANIAAETVETPAAKENGSALQFAGKLFHSLQESVNQSLNSTMELLRNTDGNSTMPNAALTQPDLIDVLCDRYGTDASAHDLTGQLLSAGAREELAGFLRQLPIRSSLINRLLTGEAATQEVMHVIKNVLPLSDNTVLQTMFQSESFEQLFSRYLQTNWSLTPEQLQQEGQPDKLYNQLAQQMNQLERLIGNSLAGSDSEQMQQQAHDIASNIALMKELSETFSYMQLPLKLPNQDTNSELYIYTQKNQRRINPDTMRVLLHLDMEHLGMVEIRLDKNRQEIQANFRLTEDASVELLRTNADLLQNTLSELGYQTNIVVSKQDNPPVTMDDFLNTKIKTNATEEMKRFSFDIRA